MIKNKNEQAVFRTDIRNKIELTPKMPAKKNINIRKKIIIGQSSAHCANRNQSKNIYSFKIEENSKLEYLHREKNLLSEEQIKNSSIYKLLE